ncbi:MAG: hypothetical protein ALAOOOJD_00983 [bacterium]|nr:hypothetical protein [bacterium]
MNCIAMKTPMRNHSLRHQLARFAPGFLLFAFCLLPHRAALAQPKIMPLGNSITAGTGSSHGGGYRLRLYELMVADESVGPFDFVGQYSSGFGLDDKNHEGHPGFTANQLAIENYLRDNPADIILLEIGTNDIASGHTAEQTATDIATVVDRIHAEAPDAVILLGTLLPQIDVSKDIDVDRTNLLLPEVISSRLSSDFKIYLVDHNKRFKANGDGWQDAYMADDLHPSDRGYELMAEEWFSALKRILKPTQKEFRDGFNRASIGEDWTTQSAFRIQSDQLVNTSTNDKWGNFFAICNVVLDPNIVEMQYGFLSDNQGRAFTGLALKLTDNNINASGYLLHHYYDKLRLWAVSNGVPTQIIEEVTGFAETEIGDVLRVEMKTDATGHHFNVFRNGNPLATLDDPQKRFNGPYCGIMINGNTNNGIDEFYCLDDRDLSSPSRVSDFTVTATTYSTMTLEWTAPGDDATRGTATSYDIRYSFNKILNDDDFAAAKPIPEKINPSEGGALERLTVGGLESGKTYHFAIKATDDQGNVSPLSNDASGSTAGLLVCNDNFGRPDGSLGESWGGDLTNLQIRSGNVQNVAAGDIWSPAVFKDCKNAVEVTIKFGIKATNFGINFAGVFVMVDGPTATPNGYMIQHYSADTPADFSDDETRLWLVQNGRVSKVIDSGHPQSNLAPKAGSKLTVRIIKENGVRYFYVYIDDVFDRVLSDPDQRYSGLYAGFVQESRLGEQNAIDEITFGAAPTGPKTMTKVLSTDNQIAPIQQPLPLPLKVTVLDSFDNALSGAAVKFSVVSGAAKITPPPSSDGSLRIEAEDGEMSGPLETRNDGDAGAGKYIVYPSSQTADATVTFNFEIKKPGTYYVWTRNIWNGNQGASWDVRSDNNSFFIYDIFYGGKSSVWAWDRVKERGVGGSADQPLNDPKTFDFNLGQHKLVFRVRFAELRLDKILLTTDPTYVPVGKEDKGFLTDANGVASAIVTMGNVSGSTTIQAALANLPPVTFTAIATGGPAAKISFKSGNGQSGAAGQSLQPFQALALDANNNPVAGQQVIWVVTNGNGTLSQYKSITGIDGIASTILKLGNSAPTNTVEARTNLAGSPIVFNATTTSGVATNAALVSAPASGLVHTTLAAPLIAKVATGNGLPVPNFPVDFRVTRGGGSLTPNFGLSNGDFETLSPGTSTPLNWTLENSPSPAEVALSTSAPRGGTKSLQINANRDGVGVSQSVNYPAIGGYTLSFYAKVISGAAQVIWRTNDVAGAQVEKVIDLTPLSTGSNWTFYTLTADNGAATARSLFFKTSGTSGNFFIDEVKISRNTDVNGQIAINFTLGDTAMAQKVQAEAKAGNTNLAGSPVTFSVQANPAAAKNQKIDSGNNQSGSAAQLLAAPFVVKVVDQYGNGISGVTLTFNVTKGNGRINGTLLKATQQTNGAGTAQVTYKLGPVSGDTNKVQVTSTGLNAVTFVSFAAIPNKVTKAGAPTAGSANKKLNQALSVKVADASGKVIAGYPVTFIIKQGGGKLNKDSTRISIPSDASGVASVFLTLGPNPGVVNRVEAYVLFNGQKLPNPVLSFAVKAAPLKNFAVSDGANQAGPVCEPLAQPLKVKISDSLNVGVAGQFVTFLVKTGGGKLNTNLDSVKVATDTAGVAQSKLTLGPKPGTNQVIARSAAKLASSPLTFTATGRLGAAATMKKVSGDSLFSLINTVLAKPQVVSITDKCGNLIAGAEVKFKIKAGGGKVNDKDSVTVTTGSDGKVQVTWKLGNVSGVFNNKLEARAFNGTAEITNSPILFSASATPNAARSIKPASATTFTGQAGTTLATPLMVKVSDGAGGTGNGVPNQPVRFLVTKGGGSFSNGSGEIIVNTDQFGLAKALWTVGGAIGTNSQEVKTFSTNAGANLEGVPVIFTATVTAGAPSAEGSEIKATGPIPADGTTKSQVTVYVRDKFGNPLQGKAVTLVVSPAGSYFIDQPTSLTNAQGVATGTFASLNSGSKTVTAKVLDATTVELTKGATVQINPLPASQMSLIGGNNQTCNILSAVGKPLRVKVADRNGNGVPNYEVKFNVQSGGGSIYEQPPVRTDEAGIASATFIGGANIGQSQIWAAAQGLNNSPVIFLATVGNNIARNLQEVRGNSQKGQVGQILPEPLVVKVTDKDGNPVAGKAVRFDVTFGGGTVDERSSTTITSDAFGEARVSWRLGPSAGPHTVRVTSTNLTNSPLDLRAEAASGLPQNLEIYSGQEAAGDVGGVSAPMRVRVTDASGNGVDGVEVLFELVRGTGSLSASGPVLQVLTREGGFASATVTFGSDAGYRRVMASAPGLHGSPRIFYPYGRALAAQTMKAVARTNNQTGTKGKLLNFPLQVLVQDRLGNPVPNFSVTYLITNGGGSFDGVNPYSTKTDSAGLAAAPWLLGRFAVDNEANAVGTGNVQPQTIVFKAKGADNNFPIFEDVLDREVTEGDKIEFSLLASDPDGDPLTYGAKNLPGAATFDSLRSRVFKWQPGVNAAGQYAISFIVRDNKGGVDEELVTIKVKNRNGRPLIESRFPVGRGIPTERDTVIENNTTLLMRVTARDPDNDPLQYRWYLNGKFAGAATSTYLFNSTERFNYVSVYVFDQEDTTSTNWLIQVPVKLSGFSATLESAATGGKAVKLEWKTASEIDNTGFNVLRSRTNAGRYEKINHQLIPARHDGQYTFVDAPVDAGGRYFYKLEDIDRDGNVTLHGPLSIDVAAPQEYVLQQNYPNPFNPTTQLRYELPKAGHVTLAIYNSLGQEVRRLVDREQPAGYHLVTWNGRDQSGKPVPTGVYHYRLQVGDFVATKKMIMAK